MTAITWTGFRELEVGKLPSGALMSSPESSSLPRWSDIEKRLLALRQLEDDWDGLGAKAPDPEVVDSALILLKHFRAEEPSLPPSRVVAGPTGSIVFEWQPGSELLIEAEIEEPGVVEYCWKKKGKQPQFQEDAFWDKNRDELWEPLPIEETPAAA